MAEYVDEWSANGLKNMFGEKLRVVELQSEAGAAASLHGALQTGALGSTFTASQGLLLMIPTMYKMAGELLPAVFHVSARTVAAHALSIFGDHSDVYATRQTGFAMLASGSVQEIMDLSGVAHLASIKSRIPFLHFFDGFRTSAEMQKVEVMEMEDLKKITDFEAIQKFRNNALNSDNPVTRGTAQNPDIFFQAKEALNPFYEPIPDIVNSYMAEINKITGRDYKPFTYYGAPDAENIIIAMGSITDTTKEVIDYLAKKGEKVGLLSVHLYRPFSAKYFFNVLPKSVKKITVLDRTKEPGSNGDPLYMDVVELFNRKAERPLIVAGRYGLSSKDTTPAMVLSVYENMKLNEPKTGFTVGIIDDVSFSSLPLLPDIDVSDPSDYSAKFYGLGADGTVGANKNSIKIIGDTTDKYCQAYFSYDSKKSGGITVSHLRFGDKPIRSPYFVGTPNFVACHVPSYINKYDVMLKGLKKGGTFLFNSIWDVEETKKRLPNHMKKYMADNNIRFYIINATAIAEELGLGTRTNTIMQAAFFKVSNVIPYEKAEGEMKSAIYKTYGRKGDKVVNMNYAAIDRGSAVTEVPVPAEWSNLEIEKPVVNENLPDHIKNVMLPIYSLKGDSLPVSAFKGREDGTFPQGTSQYEKRGIAIHVPEWIPENCTQCNRCSYVCPHAAIRPFLLTEAEVAAAPAGTETITAIPGALSAYQYRMQLSPLDCSGCGNCADICPGKKGACALVMKELATQMAEDKRWYYMHEKVGYKDTVVDKFSNVKNSQFAQPLFEFSGACVGCGETPYIKAITQLYGDRMIIGNATGCSSIYGGTYPSTPYCLNKEGKGPAWANSLFEDTAEYSYGHMLGTTAIRNRLANHMAEAISAKSVNAATIAAFEGWLNVLYDGEASKAASADVIAACEKDNAAFAKEVLSLKQYLVKKSHWAFGGDGWAYDIGFGGLDHVIAMGEDINMLVMDTEVYSNTGGQASKATPVGAVAKFAASGMKLRKKDLGVMAMSYGYVYVAQVAMGADYNQFFKALKEAEAYPGPSIIIAYSPCINHGLKGGMGKTIVQMDNAVEAGYWQMYRYNPLLEKEGKNPFQLDSKEPDWSKFQDFIKSETRYTSLAATFPQEAEKLFKEAEENAKWRYMSYKRMAAMDYSTKI